MKGLVTVFGGSGFLGTQVVRALAREGFRIRVAVRRPERAYRLPMLGDVGQVEIVQANLLDAPSTRRALAGAEACVNAVGVLYEAGPQKFMALHAEGAGALARAADAAGVAGFVQVSALGADAASPSRYARTKAAGETAVRAALPEAVILRPSVIFGPDDRFFNRFAGMAIVSPALPLIGGGKTLMQPVFVADVAKGVARALRDPAAAGRTFELGGPAVYSFRALMQLMLGAIGRRRLLIPIPFPAAQLLGFVAQLAAPVMAPPITADQVELLKSDNVVHAGAPGLAELGVDARALEPIIPAYLDRFRKGGQYADQIDQAQASGSAPT